LSEKTWINKGHRKTSYLKITVSFKADKTHTHSAI